MVTLNKLDLTKGGEGVQEGGGRGDHQSKLLFCPKLGAEGILLSCKTFVRQRFQERTENRGGGGGVVTILD